MSQTLSGYKKTLGCLEKIILYDWGMILKFNGNTNLSLAKEILNLTIINNEGKKFNDEPFSALFRKIERGKIYLNFPKDIRPLDILKIKVFLTFGQKKIYKFFVRKK